MANIRIDLQAPVVNGQTLTFKSPVDCSQITGLIVYYPVSQSTIFQFADAHGNNVGDIDHLFAADVLVKVILDTELNRAYVQNADTNAYLENRLGGKSDTIQTKKGSVIVAENSAYTPLKGLKLYDKNLFDMSILSSGYFTYNADGTVTFQLPPTAMGMPHYNKTLKELVPQLEVGKTYIFTAETTGEHKYVYLNAPASRGWYFGKSLTITEDDLNSIVNFYASGNGTSCVFSNMQIEEGTTATPYVPYFSGGDVTVKVTGKNLLDLSENTIKEVSFTASDGTVHKTYWGFELILPPGNYVMQAHTNSSGATSGYLYGVINDLNGNFLQGDFHPVYGGSLLTRRTTLSKMAKVILYDVSGTIESGRTKESAVLSFSRFDIQLETGSIVTEFEPYKSQTLTVSVPNGFGSDGFVCEDYAKLHTYAPTTTVINDVGANMELTYYTPTTAVQMVHSPADSGKILTIDEHGCVVLTQKAIADNVISFGSVIIDNVAWHYRKWANGFAECWGAFSKEGTVLASGPSSDAVSLNLALPISYDELPAYEKRPMAFVSMEAPVSGDSEHNPAYLEYAQMGGNNVDIVVRNPHGIATIKGTIYTVGCWK